jgi:CopA family copper-resistance protein
MSNQIDRRQVIRAASLLGGSAALSTLLPSWARSAESAGARPQALSGEDIRLTIAHSTMAPDGRRGHAVAINGTVPGPLIRLKEGQNVRLSVTNQLDEDTSIHWHGVLVPHQLDGVPGLSFPGIRPGQTFIYEFPVRQYGTYWYHSHSGLQEQMGHYAPIVIDPAGADPVAYDREHVVLLSDFTTIHPHVVFNKLKQQAGVFNFQKQTLSSLLAGRDQPLSERLMWAQMRMDPTDISDVTGAIYTFLINGHGPRDNWTALFAPGERVRLRFVNAAASTIFNIRIPGLRMTVVQADGQHVRPVTVDEFQISIAETYDVIVQPAEDRAFTLVAEAIDSSGMARATLAPRAGMSAAVPPLRERPLLTMKDMGMANHAGHNAGAASAPVDHAADTAAPMPGVDHAAMPGMDHAAHAAAPAMPMDHAAHAAAGPAMPAMDHAAMPGMDHAAHAAGAAAAAPPTPGMDHAAHNAAPAAAAAGMAMAGMNMRDPRNAPQVKLGPGVEMISPMPMDRTGEPGTGLENVGHKVLVYTDLVALEPNPDPRPPSRSMEIHLTGNMERFMWSFDGEKFSEVTKPIAFRRDERVRVTLVNDTMMNHPIHLHGHFFEVVNGHPGFHPRKHTVNVMPGGKVTFDLTADAPGDWAFHCHVLLHMHGGMFQVVSVRPLEGAAG